MPYLLVLILFAILGGWGLVAAALVATGIWYTIIWLVMVPLFCAIIIGLSAIILITNYRFRQKHKAVIRENLSRHGLRHPVEKGIWKDDLHYIVELDGRPDYFHTLEEARHVRDNGRSYEIQLYRVDRTLISK